VFDPDPDALPHAARVAVSRIAATTVVRNRIERVLSASGY
jgi:hypothetical protein